MPSEARRLHGFTVVSRAIRIARQMLLPAIVGGASAGDDVATAIQWILVILAVPSVLIALGQWMMFRYRVADDELVIDSGLLSRRRRVIPLARVQNIDLEQSLLERLTGVAELRLETASGGRETEASLAVLGEREAHELQSRLLERRAAALRAETLGAGAASARDPAPDGGDAADGAMPAAPAERARAPDPGTAGLERAVGAPPRLLLRLSTADLAVAGATSNEAGLIAAGLATLMQVADDLGGLDRVAGWIDDAVGAGARLGVGGAILGVAVLSVAFIVAGWVSSIIATMVRFHGFTLTVQGEDLKREYGLLTRHRSTVPLQRVQAVRIEESLLRRPLGLAALKIETAGTGPQQQSHQPGGRAEAFVPIARRRDVGRLLAEVFEDARFEGVEMQPVSPVSRRRSFVRMAAPTVLAAAGLALFLDRGWAWLGVLLVPAWLFATAQYRARGWARPPGYALVRNGVLTRTSWVVPLGKIQTLHLRESPFQRRWDLGTLLIDTAAGGRAARVVDLDRDLGAGLLADLARDAAAARRATVSSSPAG